MEQHMFWRTMWLWPCFLLGTYNTLQYEQFSANVYEVSPQLYLVSGMFISYLLWDMYAMMREPILFRNDLMIHHIFTFFMYVSGTYYNFLKTGSLFMLAESISLFNYVLRKQQRILNYYRLFTIFCIRMPIWFGFLYIHNQHFLYLSYTPYIIFTYGPTLLIIYDLFIIRKIISAFRKLH